MKKIIFAILVITFGLGVIWGAGGTYRIFTHMNWRVQRVWPPASKWADTVCSNLCSHNQWDTLNLYPRPWQKIYERDNARWISWSTQGEDTAYFFQYWFISPTFKIYDKISRATIWISVDDMVQQVRLRKLSTGETFDLGISCGDLTSGGGFLTLHRFDVTDAFRARSEGHINPSYQLEFMVVNGVWKVGLIAYISYDYGDAQRYTYKLGEMGGSGWRRISMPFYAVNSASVSLSGLFPGITAAQVYNRRTGAFQPLSISSPIIGGLGDTVRTFTFEVYLPTPGNYTTRIEGYPIFEQRYLCDTIYNPFPPRYLYFGTVNCEIPFSGNSPDDLPNGTITGDATYYNYDAEGGTGGWTSPTSIVQPRWAYRTNPLLLVGNNSRRFHLDLYCAGKLMALSEEELGEPVIFPPSEEEIEEAREFFHSHPAIPDSLCSEETTRFGKESSEENDISGDFSLLVCPTPFNTSVQVSVILPSEGNLILNIYDIEGHIIRTLFSGDATSGRYEFVWDGAYEGGKQATSGVYFIEAEYQGNYIQKKVILVR